MVIISFILVTCMTHYGVKFYGEGRHWSLLGLKGLSFSVNIQKSMAWVKSENKNYYPAVRTGSSNTHFFSVGVFFFGGHLPQTSGFRSAKQILVVFFATQARAFILGDRNIFYTRGGGEQRRGLTPLGLFLFLIIRSWYD